VDKKDTVPLTAGLRELLSPLQGNHPNVVFCYRAKRPRRVDGQLVRERGAWCPITYEGLKTAWRRKGVTIEDFRFHDTRHTAATRLLRSSRNLKLVQKLLRHEDIATTAKYAHVDDHDLMEAMERAENSRNYPRSRLRDAG
jgi:integrase